MTVIAGTKKPAGEAGGSLTLELVSGPQPNADKRRERRESLREAVFLWRTPLEAARMISGSADLSAARIHPTSASTLSIRPQALRRLSGRSRVGKTSRTSSRET